MRMLLITPTTPHRGGIAQFGTLFAQHLAIRHHISTWGFDRLYPTWLFPGSTDPDPSTQTIAWPIDYVLDGLNPVSWWQAWQSRPHIDCIIWQWWTPFWVPFIWFITWQAHRNGIKTIAICHQIVEPDAASWQARIAYWALNRADGVLFLGEAPPHWHEPHRVCALPFLNAFVTPLPQRTQARTSLALDPDAHIVLCFGFVRDYKGFDTIIHAMAHSQIPYHLLLVGEWWPLRINLTQLIHTYNLANRVHIYNHYIPNEDVATYFGAADVVALPYRSGTVSGVAGLAHHFNKPLMTSNITTLAGDYPPIARIPVDDIHAWRNALDTFFQQPHTLPNTDNDGWDYCCTAIDLLVNEIVS